ncbi:MAG: hypothetical protein K9N47_13300 [Prosthecobacter sp.]|nr:hypothetical protein [Prosthecobacter sp.]
MAEFQDFLNVVLTRCCCWRCLGVLAGTLSFGKGMKEQGNVPECLFGFIASEALGLIPPEWMNHGAERSEPERSGSKTAEWPIAEGNADD